MMNQYRMTDTKPFSLGILLVLFILLCIFSAGCGSNNMQDITLGDLVDLIPKDSQEKNVDSTPIPVDPMSIPESGEYSPDPVQVLYVFRFEDGTQVKFREAHGRDHWGYFPNGGFGQITWPDGRVEAFDANRKIRHGGLKIAKTPVTTLSHGKRMFWMADAEERKDVKKVTIFENGWNPLVEGALLATQNDIGITSPLVSCKVKVEKRK